MLSLGTEEAGGVGAETPGTGPDVTSVIAGVESAITGAWGDVGARGPSEEEGSLATERPKPEEDAGSSSHNPSGYPC